MTRKTREQREDDPKTQPAVQDRPKQVIGRFVDPQPAKAAVTPEPASVPTVNGKAPGSATPIAVFCHEPPESYIGGHVAQIIPILAKRGAPIHLFSRVPYVFQEPGIHVHAVGSTDEGDVVDQAQEYTRRAGNAFLQQFPTSQQVAVIGYEWTSAPVLSLLRGLRNVQGVLSLHTLERQRSDLTSEIGSRIAAVEREGIENARTLLVHDPATAEVVRHWLPECADRTVQARSLFDTRRFESNLDPGEIKARYQVGPIDPMILFVGDMDERYGPDILLKAMPPILRHHPQARLVLVGDGHLFWPLRVYARYLLLEHAVRLVGHVTDRPLHELVQAADMIAVPSRESTPWWPILAGWAARRPVMATHEAARTLVEHEKDSVLVYPSENSIVWGVERILYDGDLRKAIGDAGRQKLESRFGWNSLAEQVEELLTGVPVR
jgi:glycosyltransferase involved in cell wall biosynthesis